MRWKVIDYTAQLLGMKTAEEDPRGSNLPLIAALLGGSAGASLPTISLIQDLIRSKQFEERIKQAPRMSKKKMESVARAGDVGLSGVLRNHDPSKSFMEQLIDNVRQQTSRDYLRRGAETASGLPVYHGFAIGGDPTFPESIYDVHSGMGSLDPKESLGYDPKKTRVGGIFDELKTFYKEQLASSSLSRKDKLKMLRDKYKEIITKEKQFAANKGRTRVNPNELIEDFRFRNSFGRDIFDGKPTILFRREGGKPLTTAELQRLERAFATQGGNSGYHTGDAAKAALKSVFLPRQLRNFIGRNNPRVTCVAGHCGVAPNLALNALDKGNRNILNLPTELASEKGLNIVGVTGKNDILRNMSSARAMRGLAGAGAIGALGTAGAGVGLGIGKLIDKVRGNQK